MMTKDEIIRRLSALSGDELNALISIYRNHRPQKAICTEGEEVITIPEHVLAQMPYTNDRQLKEIVNNFPTRLQPVSSPNKAFVAQCKQTYIDQCYCFDEVGETLVRKALEYASSYHMKPLLIYGGPGCGKTHCLQVLSKMLGLHHERINVPLAAHGSGLAGEAGSYKNASIGLIARAMVNAKSCNFQFSGDEIDKEENVDGRPSFSDQMLKLLDDDAMTFFDNRLGFTINASHILFTFTANETSKISAPLLDRCDAIEMPQRSKSNMEKIVREGVIAKSITKAGGEIAFQEAAIEHLIQALWDDDGPPSIRTYQTIVSRCINTASFQSICEEKNVSITVEDVKREINQALIARKNKHRIGF